jgi:two-component system chemotaxis response regulator CheY
MSSIDLKPLTILVIDDNAHMRVILIEILKALGLRDIIEADDGSRGQLAVMSHEIDLIFTDLMMQPVDGLAFIRWLRNAPASPNPYVPVIMLTGHATKRSLEEARQVGVTEFLAKPLTARGVLHRINEVINNPRDFVRVPGYFGPCRRRRIDHAFAGPERRGVVEDQSGGLTDDDMY